LALSDLREEFASEGAVAHLARRYELVHGILFAMPHDTSLQLNMPSSNEKGLYLP
jgi:hypothetical protein